MPAQTIAHYRIQAKIGAGGMGEVYRATDSRLGRGVALKVLPETFARDAERMAPDGSCRVLERLLCESDPHLFHNSSRVLSLT